jgi:hypothetical protein
MKCQLAAILVLLAPIWSQAQNILLEAEQFTEFGGWDVDQQSMDVIGSPYLLAHGLGAPVKDALTTAKFKSAGLKRALPFDGPVVHLVATAAGPTGPFTKRPGEVFSAEEVMFAAEDPFSACRFTENYQEPQETNGTLNRDWTSA